MKKVDYDIFNSNIKENARDLGGLMFNGALGYVESLCSPLALLRIFREADSEFEKDRVSVYNLACHGFEALLYTAGVISHIERLVNDPSDWKSWIPVATNALGRTAGYIYNNHERLYETFFGNEELGHVSKHDVRNASEQPGDAQAKPGEATYFN